MKLYTKRGDGGMTALFGGQRVGKDDVRVEAYGSVDELNALLGLCKCKVQEDKTREQLALVQTDLLILGAHLATPEPTGGRTKPRLPELPLERVEEMERWIDEAEARLPELRRFILPAGCEGAAQLHLARTVCRRAERRVVGLSEVDGALEPFFVRYLNRLSDYLFTVARLENLRAGLGDTEWNGV